MAHRLLLPPASRRLNGTIRLPPVQHLGHAIAQNLQATLMDRDAFRRVKTTARNRICQGPLPTPQVFVTVPSGGVNTAASMRAGAHKMNASRSVSKTRGQSAGI